MKENIWCLAVASMSRSMFGNGKSSFRQARFRSLKSTKILIWLFFLRTGTTLANQIGRSVGLRKLASRSFLIFSLIWSSISVRKTRLACFTGLALWYMLRWCVVTFVARQGMCEYYQAKTSLYYVSKHINAARSVGESFVDKNIGRLGSKSTCSSFCSWDFGLSW